MLPFVITLSCTAIHRSAMTVGFGFSVPSILVGRSQWPCGLRRRSAAARLLRSWFRIPPGAWMFVCCECCVLSGRGLCDELITRPEKSYRLWCVVVCDLETSRMRRPWPALGRSATEKKSILVELRSVHESNVGLIFSINDRHPHHFAKHCWFTVRVFVPLWWINVNDISISTQLG